MVRFARIPILMVIVAVVICGHRLAAPQPEAAEPQPATGEVTQGALHVVPQPGEKLQFLEFPLEHTDVEAYIAGMVAHVTVTQRFGNPYDNPIEAVYVFPLPHNAAVNDMVMKVGDRSIRGLIKKREEAKRIYEEAKAAGKRTSLLEQERPNIFTQSVANIMPGDTILITITYDEKLNYEDGRYDFVFPMVVEPRYMPGSPKAGASKGGGWSPDTDVVPDASRISPPVLRPEQRSGHDIDVSVYLDAGVPIRDLRSKSHQISTKDLGPSAREVHLKPSDRIPNKDFVLSYDVAGKRPEMALLAHRGDSGGFFLFMLQPKAEYRIEEITPKEMVFVVDSSGSMSGFPIEKAKACMRRCLQGMHPKDSFQIIRFSNRAESFAPAPVPNTPENVESGLKYVDTLAGNGGTEMLSGVNAALDYPHDPDRLRIVFFMSDGCIGNETQILDAIQKKGAKARVFPLGVGTSTNRWLLDSMAKVGRGAVQYIRPDEDDAEVVTRFYERIAKPYLTDIEIDWGRLEVSDVYPDPVLDLFAGQPVVVFGRYEKGGEATITVKAKLAGEPWRQRLSVDLPEVNSGNPALTTLWARRRIEDLMSRMHGGGNPEIVERVTDLALEFRLMSNYTSFVAVEEQVVNEGGELKTVQVPVPIPEMVSYEGIFGNRTFYGRGETKARAMLFKSHGAGSSAARMSGGPGVSRAAAPPAEIVSDMQAFNAPMALDGFAYRGGPTDFTFTPLPLTPPGSVLAVAAYGGEGWTTNQDGLPKLLAEASQVIALGGAWQAGVASLARLGDLPKEADLRIIFLTGKDAVTFTDGELKGLVGWLEGGGFLIVDSAGDGFYESVIAALTKALPKAEFKHVGLKHDIYRGAAMPYTMRKGCPIVERLKTSGPAQGLFGDAQLTVFISRGNLGSAWSAARDEKSESAYRMGINLLSYALQR